MPHDPELLADWTRQRHIVCPWLRRTDGHTELEPFLGAHAEERL
jgi:hypothetical protein